MPRAKELPPGTYTNMSIHFPDWEVLARIRRAAAKKGVSPGA